MTGSLAEIFRASPVLSCLLKYFFLCSALGGAHSFMLQIQTLFSEEVFNVNREETIAISNIVSRMLNIILFKNYFDESALIESKLMSNPK